MSLIKIEAIKNEDKVSNNGKSYTRCSIKTLDRNGAEQWISGFGNETTKSWKKGQTVDIEIYSEDYQGKTYYKFKEPAERNVFTELDEIKAILHQIRAEIGNHTTQPVETLQGGKSGQIMGVYGEPRQEEPTFEQIAEIMKREEEPKDPINVEEIPF